MIRFRALSALLIAFALALASLTASVARVDAAGAAQAVICTGHGVTTLLLDAQGQPVGPTHPCPKCLAGMMAVALSGPLAPPALAVFRRAVRLDLPALAGKTALVPPCARGPPRAAA